MRIRCALQDDDGAAAEIELERLPRFQLQFRKIVERPQAERLQKERRRLILHRAADDVFAPRFDDQSAIEQRAHDAVGVDAANRFDLASRHGLNVRDDRERFHRRRRERRLGRKQIGFDDVASQRRRCETIAAGDFAHDDAAIAVLGLDLLQRRGDLRFFGVEQLGELRNRECLAGDEEQRLDRTLQLRCAHAAVTAKRRMSSKARAARRRCGGGESIRGSQER